MKRAFKILGITLGGIVLLLLILLLLLRSSLFQNYLSQKVLTSLEKNINGNFELENIKVDLNSVSIENFAIHSSDYTPELREYKRAFNQSDTLVKINKAKIYFSIPELLKDSLKIKKIVVDGGEFNLQQEIEDVNVNRIFPKSEKESNHKEFLANISDIEVNNFRFTLSTPKNLRYYNEDFIDFSNLDVRNISLKALDIAYYDGEHSYTKAKIEHLTGVDKSGFALTALSGDVVVDGKRSLIENLYMSDGYSIVKSPAFALKYSNAKSFSNFIDSVRFDAKLNNSLLDFRTLGKITPNLESSTLKINIDGSVEGPISELNANNILATSTSGQTNINVSKATLVGLPNASESIITIGVEQASTNGKDLSTLLSELTGSEKIDFLYNMPPLSVFNYKGSVEGKFTDLKAKGIINGAGASSHIDTRIKTADIEHKLNITGKIATNNFNVASLIGNKNIGAFSGNGLFSVKGVGEKSTVYIDSVHINSLNLFGYNLTNTFVTGDYSNNLFRGKVIAHDSAIDMLFQGEIPTSKTSDKPYKIYANIPYADLNKLGIDHKERRSEISMVVNADFTMNEYDEIFGNLKINDAYFSDNNSSYNLGDIVVTSDFKDDKYNVDINSNFLKAKYQGNGMITTFYQEFKNLVLDNHFNNLLRKERDEIYDDEYQLKYNLTLETFNTQGVCALLADGLYIQSGSSLNVNITDNDDYRITLNSGRIAFEDNYLKNIRLNIRNRDSILVANLFSKDLSIAGFQVDSTSVTARGADNDFDIRVRFRNDTTGANRTNLALNTRFLKDSTLQIKDRLYQLQYPIEINIKESDLKIKGAEWNIVPSTIIYSDSLLYVNNLKIENGIQSLKAGGFLSNIYNDSLGIKMERFDIAIIDQFLSKPFNLQGYLSGMAAISQNKSNPKMFATITGDSIAVNNSHLGKLQLLANWSDKDKYYNLGLLVNNNGEGEMAARGYYRPEDSYIDISTELNNISLNYVEPMLSSVISNTSGNINGTLRIFGETDNLNIIGQDCKFDNYKFTLDYTKVPYTLNGAIGISEDGIDLSKCTLTDNFSGKATISGGIKYKSFKDLKIDTKIRMTNIQALNTKDRDNEDFYGSAFASGEVGIKGDLEEIALDINARTEPNTLIHIPVSRSSNATKTELLTFVVENEKKEIDPYDSLYMRKTIEKQNKLNMAVNLQVNASPNAEIWLEVDKSTGDIIKAKGNGRIGINVNPAKEIFNLTGNYVIQSGSYHFVLMGLTSRDFSVEEGSQVTLNGAPSDIDLDITALYKTKAAVNRLIADTSSVNTTRNVDASIMLKGKMANPQIKFGIDIPDLDPTTKVKVQNALNTDEKIQKQMAALLVSGGFVPDVESGVSSSSNMLYSNASDMISNQLNNIFGQLGIPLDLGFNYVPGEKSASDAFDVAISTQLFNNRVLINGSIGNDPYSDYNGRNVIGNVDVEIKLDRKGELRLNLFSHSTDRYSNDLEESQRNGVGIAYQREFNSLRELLRKKSAAQKEFEKLLKERSKEEKKRAKKSSSNSQ